MTETEHYLENRDLVDSSKTDGIVNPDNNHQTMEQDIGTQRQQQQQQPKHNISVAVDGESTSIYEMDPVIGCIRGEYLCSYGSWNGTLFAGSFGIMFMANFFLFEKKLVLLWDNISQVREVPVINTDCADVTMIDNIHTVHRFIRHSTNTCGDVNRDKLWITFVGLHNESLLTTNGGENSTDCIDSPMYALHSPTFSHNRGRTSSVCSSIRQSQYRRRNSDPVRKSTKISQTLQHDLLTLDFNNESDHDEKSDMDSEYIHTNEVLNKRDETHFPFSPHDSTHKPIVVKQRLATISTSTEFAEFEKITGQMLLPPIQCSNSEGEIGGKLYTGRTALYFSGQRFFWEKSTATMPWSDIQSIKSITVLLDADNKNGMYPKRQCVGISITIYVAKTTGSGNESTTKNYQFIYMENADQVWASLSALLNDYSSLLRRQSIISVKNSPDGLPEAVSIGDGTCMRRRNSDPLFRSNRIGNDTNVTSSTPEGSYDSIANNLGVDTTIAQRMPSHLKSVDVQSHERNGTSALPSFECSNILSVSTVDDHDGWVKATTENTESKETYSTILINNVQIPDCDSIDTFFDLFLGNDARYSLLGSFLETLGDTNIRIEQWHPYNEINEKNDNRSSSSRPKYTRIVRYIHPVNVPLAPPQASARREQIYERYGPGTGIIIESRTYVDDVPMADCFYAAERFRISPGIKNNTISLSIDFGITFVKSTMFKGIITKKTTSEVSDGFNAMITFINKSLEIEKSNKKLVYVSNPAEPCSCSKESINPLSEKEFEKNLQPLSDSSMNLTTGATMNKINPNGFIETSFDINQMKTASSDILRIKMIVTVLLLLLLLLLVLILLLLYVQYWTLLEIRSIHTVQAEMYKQIQVLNELSSKHLTS